jgi:hypothetical protein
MHRRPLLLAVAALLAACAADPDTQGDSDECQLPTTVAATATTNVISATATQLSADANPCTTDYPPATMLDCAAVNDTERSTWRERLRATHGAARGLPSIILVLAGEPASGRLTTTTDTFPSTPGTGQVIVQELGASVLKEWIATDGTLDVTVSPTVAGAAVDPSAVQVSVAFDVTMGSSGPISQTRGTFRLAGTAHCDPLAGWPE